MSTEQSATTPDATEGAVPATMRAALRHEYGQPHDVLAVETTEVPQVPADRVLLRVAAASVNQLDSHLLTGTPYLMRPQFGLRRPKRPEMGADVAGTIVRVGAEVEGIAVGDRVVAETAGAFAEYALANPAAVSVLPDDVSFEDAAATPVAGLTALQGLRDHGGLEPGQSVLILGASGSVGTFAVQLATIMGGEVTAVCSTRNVETASKNGATRVIDYTKTDVTTFGERFDLVVDVAGKASLADQRSLVKPGGTIVAISGPKRRWLGPLPRIARAKLGGLFRKGSYAVFVARANTADLAYLMDLIESGELKPTIERVVLLDDIVEALAYQGEGHAMGKTVVRVGG